jgi:hypothetical protein
MNCSGKRNCGKKLYSAQRSEWDQRTSVLSAGLIAAGGAVAAAALALSAPDVRALRMAAICGAVVLVIGATLCGWACRPQRFRFPGIEPLDWGADPDYLTEPLKGIKVARAAKIQDDLAGNERQQRLNGRILTAGLLAAAASPLAALIGWALTRGV